MTTLGGTAVTLLDILKAQDPKGNYAKIVEILNQKNEILEDMKWMMCNDGTSHQTSVRTGLPSGTYRTYNTGVNPTKGTSAQVRVGTCMLEAVCVVDRDLADRNGNREAYRAGQAKAHIEGLSEQVASAMFYEDERTNPTRFTGLAAHYSSITTTTAASAQNVIDCGGTGSDNSSIWILTHGDMSGVMGLYPDGFVGGLKVEDRGEQRIIDATAVTGASFIGLEHRFSWKPGLCVQDWTQNARVANIDISNLRAQVGDADLVTALIRASELLPTATGNRVMYMNRTLKTWLRVQAKDAAYGHVTFDSVGGKPMTQWDGIPIKVVDKLLNTESALT